MNITDRLIVKNLLQSMTDSCLFHSDEFRAALKHFKITTTYAGQQVSDEAAVLLGKEHNHFVDVFYPSRIDAHPHGERFGFKTKAEAEEFAARERTNGDQPTVQNAIDAAHAEALEINARRRVAEFFGGLDHAGRQAKIEEAHAEALEMDAVQDCMVIDFASPLLATGMDNFMFVKRLQGWSVLVDADKEQVVLTR